MTLTAVLFAGGKSSRMGTDKAVLQILGQPLWARQIELLRRLQPEVLWLSARTRPAWCPPEMQVVFDASPSRGPLSGLTETLRRLRTSHLLALAVDLPLVNLEMLQRVRMLAKPGCGIVPVNNGRFEPLCAIYPREASARAFAALDQGELSLQRMIGTLANERLMEFWQPSEVEQSCFLNVNRPSDLKRIK